MQNSDFAAKGRPHEGHSSFQLELPSSTPFPGFSAFHIMRPQMAKASYQGLLKMGVSDRVRSQVIFVGTKHRPSFQLHDGTLLLCSLFSLDRFLHAVNFCRVPRSNGRAPTFHFPSWYQAALKRAVLAPLCATVLAVGLMPDKTWQVAGYWISRVFHFKMKCKRISPVERWENQGWSSQGDCQNFLRSFSNLFVSEKLETPSQIFFPKPETKNEAH